VIRKKNLKNRVVLGGCGKNLPFFTENETTQNAAKIEKKNIEGETAAWR
jgi:hypothetical protein